MTAAINIFDDEALAALSIEERNAIIAEFKADLEAFLSDEEIAHRERVWEAERRAEQAIADFEWERV